MKPLYILNIKNNKPNFLLIIFCLFFLYTKSQTVTNIDSVKNSIAINKLYDRNYIEACFFLSDYYVEKEISDSAQIWLNKVHKIVPIKKASIFNYLLTSRQAEVYYYNNLLQLGLQESNRALEIANQLNDSFLIADSYNFRGLFYIGLDSLVAASNSLLNAAKLVKLPSNKGDNYKNLSKPHHVYNNLAESYFKRNLFDSAIYYSKISYVEASKIKIQRGIAMANISLADAFVGKGSVDSAIQYYIVSKQIAVADNQIDVVLLCFSGLAKSYLAINNISLATKYADEGLAYIFKSPKINILFSKQFLDVVIIIFDKLGNKKKYLECVKFRKKLEDETTTKENKQLITILNSSIENEKAFLNLEIQDAKRKQQLANTQLLLALGSIFLLGIVFLIYRYYQRQKNQVHKIRQEISQDLHDDIGASLSSLQIYGAVAEKIFYEQPQKALEMLHKIATQSKLVMENMNDIVWSMNNNDTNAISLEAKIKNYAVELLSNNNINFTCSINEQIEQVLKSITAKRNLLLIIKEALNNIAKYSDASTVVLRVYVENKILKLVIEDNGVGFNMDKHKIGNGISNMQKRTAELGGDFVIHSSHLKGTNIEISIPLNSL